MSRERIHNHPGHASQKSHGRKGGGEYVEGKDISKSADYDALSSKLNTTKGDAALGDIQREQGFDGKPQVVSRQEFDAAVAAGEVRETFRGINGEQAAEYAEGFRSGDLHPGTGYYGNGTYVATDRGLAEGYGAGGVVMRVGLRSDARVIEYSDAVSQMKRELKGGNARIDALDKEMYREVLKVDDDTSARMAVYDRYKGLKQAAAGPAHLVQDDPGRYAALRGYDAINVVGDGQLVILNRTALIVEEA
jgi:hypothetical protein